MADRRFKVGEGLSGEGIAAIWTGAGDTLPFTDPLTYADRVLFTTKFNYTRIVQKWTGNVVFPKTNGGGERSGTINLFAHGISGVPRVRGNITIKGNKLSLGCHVPVQFYEGDSGGLTSPEFFRIAVLGATSTNVVVAWFANLSVVASKDYLKEITVPITVEVTNELN